MTIPIEELQQNNPSAIIELFELELVEGLHYQTGNPDNIITTYRWHSGVTEDSTGQLSFGGQIYSAMPIEAEGFDYKGTSKGSSTPRPTLRISNLLSTVSTILAEVNGVTPYNDLIGAKVTRKTTFAKFISATNTGGQTITYVVTVQSLGGVNYFYLNGVYKPVLNLVEGNTYRFVQSDSTNTGHPLILKYANGNELAGVEISKSGTAGTDGVLSYIVTSSNQAARYSCSVHGNTMGNIINITSAPSNPHEDANMRFQDQIYKIDRKANENKSIVEFELAANIDFPNVQIPFRQALPREFPGIGSFHA